MNTLRLERTVTGILADDGSGTVTCQASTGPEKYGDVWRVTLLSAYSNSSGEIQLRVFRNVAGGTQVDSTYAAKSDTSSCDITLQAGEKLVFVWTGGVAGAVVSVDVSGDLISRR
jgi:hypothetical protein